MTIRTVHDSGNTATLRTALAVLATHFDRLGRYEPAATFAGFAVNPLNIAGLPELSAALAHLREVLGDATYESLARKGSSMTAPAVAVYALDQIDQALAELRTYVWLCRPAARSSRIPQRALANRPPRPRKKGVHSTELRRATQSENPTLPSRDIR